ncbi:MAG: hypothetical protein J3K34DRAFT_224213 [Monoraphidium minutum]|nr:MAG: hypothetical protein J3K34DRAFT_224213 [Monoraphidium minutum]
MHPSDTITAQHPTPRRQQAASLPSQGAAVSCRPPAPLAVSCRPHSHAAAPPWEHGRARIPPLASWLVPRATECPLAPVPRCVALCPSARGARGRWRMPPTILHQRVQAGVESVELVRAGSGNPSAARRATPTAAAPHAPGARPSWRTPARAAAFSAAWLRHPRLYVGRQFTRRAARTDPRPLPRAAGASVRRERAQPGAAQPWRVRFFSFFDRGAQQRARRSSATAAAAAAAAARVRPSPRPAPGGVERPPPPPPAPCFPSSNTCAPQRRRPPPSSDGAALPAALPCVVPSPSLLPPLPLPTPPGRHAPASALPSPPPLTGPAATPPLALAPHAPRPLPQARPVRARPLLSPPRPGGRPSDISWMICPVVSDLTTHHRTSPAHDRPRRTPPGSPWPAPQSPARRSGRDVRPPRRRPHARPACGVAGGEHVMGQQSEGDHALLTAE